MRVIAGKYGSRTLLAPPGRNTRPTTDRVREAMFSILWPDLPGARVLDLFCGSGALAIEAISRGADSAVMVDKDAKTLSVAKKNADTLQLGDQCRLIRADYLAAVSLLKSEGLSFDLILLDPPYQMGLYAPALAAIAENALLKADGVIMAEHPYGMELTAPESMICVDQRKYGDTALSFFKMRRDEQ